MLIMIGRNDEIWKDVVEFPDHYEISNLGRIRGKIRGCILKTQIHKTGCERVRLCVNKVKYSRSIHRLVAKTFIENPKNKPEVNHIDGDRLNNLATNLEWCTKQENMDHAVKEGLINNPFGEESRNFKGAVEVLTEGGDIVDTLFGNKDMTDKGYCYKQISAVLRGKQLTHKGFKYRRIYE